MGLLRCLLAVLVMASHAGWRLGDVNPGVSAVVIFFMISGYVMTALLHVHYTRLSAMGAFLLDRCARLFPQFLFYTLLAGCCVRSGLLPQPFWVADTSWLKFLGNFLMLPNGFYMFLGMDRALVLPQSWTLGLELCFYAVFPLLIGGRRKLFAGALTVLVFIAAWSGHLATDVYGYRLLPGTLFIFLSGSAMYDLRKAGQPAVLLHAFLLAVWLGAGALYIAMRLHPYLAVPNNPSVLVGILVGLPLVYGLSGRPETAFSRYAGDLSYGLYLNHFLGLWIVQAWLTGATVLDRVVLVLLPALAMSAATYRLLERPVLRRRRRWRAQYERSH